MRARAMALHADGFYRHTGDYDTPLGTQANSFFHGKGGSLGDRGFWATVPHRGCHRAL
jgi:iron complex outermembrane receptor protein